MSEILDVQHRFRDEVCKECCGLDKFQLHIGSGRRTGQYIIANTLKEDCSTCQLLAKGLEHFEHQLLALYLKWMIRWQDDGLVFQADNNGATVIVEFYYMKGKRADFYLGFGPKLIILTESPIIPPGILRKAHVGPWWEDDGFLNLGRELVSRDRPHWAEFDSRSKLQCPTRLLDLTDDFDLGELHKNIKLIEPMKDRVEVASYIILSHTWGRPPHAKTRRLNMEQQKQEIPFQDLTPTLQSAVIAARRLRMRYLWIDSLCIIQPVDDNYDAVAREDWAQEGAKMHEIYANSSATIAIHSNSVETGGQIRDETLHFTTDGSDTSAEIRVRLLPNPEDLLHNIATAPSADRTGGICEIPSISPLEKWDKVSLRGWCYQERALSQRVLHITASELLLEEDGQITDCQCGNHHTRPAYGFAGWLASKLSQIKNPNKQQYDRARRAWSQLVKQYTQRMLGRESDLLPGMAGVVSLMSQDLSITMGKYVAGLWENNLLHWLCWKSMPWTSARPGDAYCENCRPHPRRVKPNPYQSAADVKYNVPSFSWASRFGPAEFMEEHWRTDEYVPVAEIVQVRCKTDSGMVSWGFIDFKAATLYPVLHFSTIGWMVPDFRKSTVSCSKHYACVVDVDFPRVQNMDSQRRVLRSQASRPVLGLASRTFGLIRQVGTPRPLGWQFALFSSSALWPFHPLISPRRIIPS